MKDSLISSTDHLSRRIYGYSPILLFMLHLFQTSHVFFPVSKFLCRYVSLIPDGPHLPYFQILLSYFKCHLLHEAPLTASIKVYFKVSSVLFPLYCAYICLHLGFTMLYISIYMTAFPSGVKDSLCLPALHIVEPESIYRIND